MTMKLAYLSSRYPAVSHTFIMREVLGLRGRGVEVDTFTVRRVTPDHLLTDTDEAENERTFSILPVSPWRLAIAHLLVLLAHPLRYWRAAWTALSDRQPGLRALLWQLFYFAEAGVLAFELRRRGIGHVHVHFANVASGVAMLATRMLGIRWSLSLHGQSDFGDPVFSRLPSKVGDVAFVICVSDYGRALAMLHSSVEHSSKIHVIRCGVDPDQFRPKARGKAGRGPEPIRLITVARLSPEKGLVFLLESIHELVSAGLDVTSTVIGDGPERGRLERCVERWRIAGHLRLIGSVGHDELNEYYRQADVFVLPSLAEGLPIVLMEAMACGLPVIASRVAGIPELVESGVSGVLVSPGRVDELAAAIRSLADNEQLRWQMGLRGRERVVEAFNAKQADRTLFERFREELQDESMHRSASAVHVRPRSVNA